MCMCVFFYLKANTVCKKIKTISLKTKMAALTDANKTMFNPKTP